MADKRDAAIHVDGSASLRAHGEAAGLPVGCAVITELLDLTPASQDPYTHTVVQQAGILVAENAMKWSSLRPTSSTFNFAQSDRLFDFAEQNGQLVRGHNLCWHEQLPPWFGAEVTHENAAQMLQQHIQAVAGRYAGRVHSWDVVNEAIHPPDGRADGLRLSPWLSLIGPEYIELAFSTAFKADPHARLTLNEFGIELDTPEQTAKRAQLLMLVRRLLARSVPLHAIGVQSHLLAAGPQPGSGLVKLIRDAASLGLEMYITELDVNSRNLPESQELQDAAVAAVYRNYLGLVLAEPNVKALLTWGISDAHTWLNQTVDTSQSQGVQRPDGVPQRPLPFDERYAPTPAFFAIRGALDTARKPSVPPNSVRPTGKSPDPFAPFAVPGSPPLPTMPSAPTPNP
jgi:endo-1,4-beta-xylanase